MDKPEMIVSKFIVVMLVSMILGLVTVGMWYCFDDTLAEVTGVKQIGELDFWMIWPMTVFVRSVTSRTAIEDRKKSS